MNKQEAGRSYSYNKSYGTAFYIIMSNYTGRLLTKTLKFQFQGVTVMLIS